MGVDGRTQQRGFLLYTLNLKYFFKSMKRGNQEIEKYYNIQRSGLGKVKSNKL